MFGVTPLEPNMLRRRRANPDDLADLALELACALQEVGAPANEVEAAIRRLCASQGVEAQVLSTPTSIQLGLDAAAGSAPVFRVARVRPGHVQLARREALEALIVALTGGSVRLSEGPRRLAEVQAAPAPWGPVALALAEVAVGGLAAVFFGGGAVHAAVAAGAAAAILGVAALVPAVERLLPLLGSAVGTAVTILLSRWVGLDNAWPALLGGMIALAPGYTLTVASSELAAQELVSGTARLVSAGLTFLQLLLGMAGTAAALGAWTSGELAPMPPAAVSAVLVAAVGAGLGFTVLLQARARDAGLVVAAVLFASGLELVGSALGAGLWGPFLAATGLAAVSVLFAARTRHAEALLLAPGMLALVPGGMGLGSLTALLLADLDAGVATLLGTGLAAVALGSGLLLGNLVGLALVGRSGWAVSPLPAGR